MIYGGSAHAFLVNIHEALCPSGPYCFRRESLFPLIRNLGLEVVELGFFHAESTGDERSALERALRAALGEGVPCALVNMEYQLITGTDDTGFLTARPWPMDFPPDHLTFGSWAEFGAEVHADLCALRRVEPASGNRIVADGLAQAVDFWRHPGKYSGKPYGAGPEALALWIAALRAGHGAGHGAWWNATVWSECRARAADFFEEIAGRYPSAAPRALALAAAYREIAASLAAASDRKLPAPAQVALVEQAAAREAASGEEIAALAAEVPGPPAGEKLRSPDRIFAEGR
jgi:hypothetical protein